MANRLFGFTFEREARLMTVIDVLLPLLAILFALVIPWMGRRLFS